ncbi:Manganese-dependent ADP-ribose/CDP-alcohol diphosphatase [Neorhizobium galegae bv. officinalis bv. officinalis str. HAMBI 1141]|uniref:Manganese-dependent ADP-ribose/CDP-alcohol diphosphatase n=1 Tax=Neorhizobium galegae bv. officinalis bv. officinalis str. HAMBI 1141 TaxID=1028801 RepID=A0A068T3R7_NEOGA|nr:metallophosphoesterase [Neorhizobium galegae]CDN53113.1 Manganese-dependent ADP-ribose/CDP-alcohol diphosphatase [Neorhizobium galegae bv. officinalis bv. officinalis str. HAMBI 1141]
MPHEKPLLRFGVIADPQYADLPPWLEMDRYYANSLDKLRQAIGVLNGEDLSFVVTLGDLIDRGWESYDPVLAVYQGLRHESFLMPGNHDFFVAPAQLGDVHKRLGMPAAWHDFARDGVRFVVIDGNEISLFSTPGDQPRHALAQRRLETLLTEGAINAKEWNGGIGDEQFGWLEAVLARASAADEKVVVMGHYPLYPENEHNLWGAERLTDLFARSGNVIAYLNGHNHVGNLGRTGNTWYVNFKGMVDTQAENTFAVVEIFADRIEIIGHGREESRTLAL